MFSESVIFAQRIVRKKYMRTGLRRQMLSMMFDREHQAMRVEFAKLARKNRKLKAEAKLFEKPIDEEIKSLIIEEFLSNICEAYVRYKLTIRIFYDSVMKARAIEALDDDPYLNEQELRQKIESSKVGLSREQSFELYLLREKIRHHLQNVFSDTQNQEVMGDVSKVPIQDKSQECSLMQKIAGEMNFVQNSNMVLKPKSSSTNVQLFTISKPPKKPFLRYLAARVTIQRMVRRYNQILASDKLGRPFQFEKFDESIYR